MESRREVFGTFSIPTGNATGWGDIFDTFKSRGTEEAELVWRTTSKTLAPLSAKKFPARCFGVVSSIWNATCSQRPTIEIGTCWPSVYVAYPAPESIVIPWRQLGKNGSRRATVGVRTAVLSNQCTTIGLQVIYDLPEPCAGDSVHSLRH